MLYPNLRHLRLLKACGQEGGIGRAAERVGLSQPAASQALSRLESFYQCVLLERGRDRIRPTPDAARVLARGDRAFDYVRTACREAAARGKGGGAQSADRLAERVTIAQLRALQSLAEAGSFAGAARLLEQSDTAVQRAVRSAEEVLGAPLLREGARAAVLSPAGQIVARCFWLALRELDSAREDISSARGEPGGRVVIGALPLARTTIVPDAVASIARTHGAVRFEIVEGTYDQLISDLAMGRVDLLAGALRPTINAAFARETLFGYQFAVIGRAEHPLSALKRRPRADELAAYPWVVPRRGTPGRAIFEQLASQFPVPLGGRGVVETGSLSAVMRLLQTADHLAFLPYHQLKAEVEKGVLAVLDHPVAPSERPLGIVTRRDWMPTSLQRDYIDALRAAAARLSARSDAMPGPALVAVS
jgi:LysR family transcriptional regulator, regulator for genes of the gallate degradation pathway